MKLERGSKMKLPNGVAPRRGAWIETATWKLKDYGNTCRTPQGCVD